MKLMKMSVTLFAVSFTAVGTIFAQTTNVPPVPIATPITIAAVAPVTVPPAATVVAITPTTVTEIPWIASSGLARTKALNEATEVNGQLSSAAFIQPKYGEMLNEDTSDLPDSYDFRKWTGRKSAVEIFAEIKKLDVGGRSIDTKETVSTYISVMNKDGVTLFRGYKEVKPVSVNEEWVLPESASNISLVQLVAPITFDKDVASAVVVTKSKYGGYYPYVNTDGKNVYLSSAYVGLSDSYVRVQFADGTAAGYSLDPLDNGKQVPVAPLADVRGKLSATFANVFTYNNPNTVSLVVKSVKNVGVVPVIEITMTTAGNVAISVKTEEGELPAKFRSKTIAAEKFGDPTAASPSGITIMALPVGVTYIVPEFDPAKFTEEPTSGSSGGYGGVSAATIIESLARTFEMLGGG